MISIIIPACNEQEYLEDTIQSIRAQNHKHEIIVVCDGCTDNTPGLATKLADKFVILNQRKGPATAKNEGVNLAKYDKLVFLDADTKLTENSLKEISKCLDNDYIGTCKRQPSNKKLKHKIMNFCINLYPLPLTNGIIFCTKQTFNKIKGFPEIKKGEDGKFIRKLTKENSFILLKTPVISSTRRFDKKGYVKVMFYWIREYIKPSDKDYEIIM